MRPLRLLLRFIGAVQIFFGLLFALFPGRTASLLSFQPAAPAWVQWLLVMSGARFLAFGYGMFVAARDPERHQGWINAMIAVQIVDWVGTVGYLLAGDVAIRNVSSASFLPVLFIGGLLWWHPARAVPKPAEGLLEATFN